MDHQQDDDDDDDDDDDGDDDSYPEDILLSLIGVRTAGTGANSGPSGLEEKIAGVLSVAANRISIVDVDSNPGGNNSRVMFAVYPNDEAAPGPPVTAEQFAQRMNTFIKDDYGENTIEEWLYPVTGNKTSGDNDLNGGTEDVAHCTVAELEEEVAIEEEEAFQLWHDIPEESRTCHLAMVPSPDGDMIQPTHDHTNSEITGNNYGSFRSAIEAQLQRDPSLLELDNVPRIDISQLGNPITGGAAVSWTEPVIITGCVSPSQRPSETDNGNNSDACLPLLTRAHLLEKFGKAEVRTGNRNTLVENGFDNSVPMELGKAIEYESEDNNAVGDSSGTRSRIVFSPVKELPDLFREDLEFLLAAFPAFPCIDQHQQHQQDQQQHQQHQQEVIREIKHKYTLCIAGKEGFGIGFHKHNAALFMLLVGRKKWYMGSSSTLDQSTEPTHPGFYTSKSSHKCIQQPGEVLYVPDQWYHEIFNFEYTAGIQALPD